MEQENLLIDGMRRYWIWIVATACFVVIVLSAAIIVAVTPQKKSVTIPNAGVPNAPPFPVAVYHAPPPIESTTRPPVAVQNSPPVTDVTVSGILLEYSDNEVAADAKYKHNWVRFTGRIHDIGVTILGHAYICIGDEGLIQCTFDDKRSVMNLHTGKMVTVTCVADGKILSMIEFEHAMANVPTIEPVPVRDLPAWAMPNPPAEDGEDISSQLHAWVQETGSGQICVCVQNKSKFYAHHVAGRFTSPKDPEYVGRFGIFMIMPGAEETYLAGPWPEKNGAELSPSDLVATIEISHQGMADVGHGFEPLSK